MNYSAKISRINIDSQTKSPDVVVIGAGPVGCVAALAFARKGAKVLLLEANPDRFKRLAGEWLHPPGLEIIERLGITLTDFPTSDFSQGKGFVVFPDDRTAPIQLNYPDSQVGLACEHNILVQTLREATLAHPKIEIIYNACVTHIEGQKLYFQDNRYKLKTVLAKEIIGADGRNSTVRKSLGVSTKSNLVSYMAGVLLSGVELPFEEYGHVLLGNRGLALIYRIGKNKIRACFDVSIEQFRNSQNKAAYLWDAYSPILPEVLRPAFREALLTQNLVWSANQFCPRLHYGRQGLALVGDASGYCHPMTATGMTLGFQDVESLVESKSFREFKRDRLSQTYVPELLATSLYQVFSHQDESALAIRRGIYQMWREDPIECWRTMSLLSGTQTKLIYFSKSFFKGVKIALTIVIKDNAARGKWTYLLKVIFSFRQWLQIPLAIALPRICFLAEIKYSQFTKLSRLQTNNLK